MATGDLTNNIRKLQKELKSMKYQETLDLSGLALGKASALLPIYHYAFTTYSCAIAELIAGTDTELYTKTDLRFMEGCYKILRDLFHYKPPITKEQFFNSGFVERKIIMCTEVMKLIQKKNKSLQPPRKAPTTTTSNLAQVISTKANKPKVTDLTQVRPGHQRSRPRSSTDSLQREVTLHTQSVVSPRSLTENDQPQVVNELLQPVGNIPRHVAHPHHRSAECEPTREADSSSSSEVSDIALGDYNQRSPPVHVASVTSPPRVTKEVLPSVGDVRGFNWAVVTPSIAKTKSTLSNRSDYPGSRVCFDEEEDDDDEGDNDIETVMAATPAHSIMEPPQNGVTMATVQASPGPSSNTQSAQTGQQMSTNETHILKAIEQLTKCFGTLESGLTRSIESLNARMILVENRVSMMENKIEMVMTNSQRTEQPALQSVNPGREYRQVSTASAPREREPVVVPQRTVTNQAASAPRQRESALTSQTSATIQAEIPMNGSHQLKDDKESQIAATNKYSKKSPELKGPPSQSALYDESTLVMFSPIRHVAGSSIHQQTPESTFCSTNIDPNDPRLSSTPARGTAEMDTQLVLGESMNLQSGDMSTQDQVSRIKNLFKSTEIMLKQ